MKHVIAAPLIVCLFFAPSLSAQETDAPLSPMERGAQLFLEGLMKEMAPALKELESLADEAAPALRRFAEEMGPAMSELLESVEDWSVYAAPEVLPNGDIIIRRKPAAPKMDPDLAPQIDL